MNRAKYSKRGKARSVKTVLESRNGQIGGLLSQARAISNIEEKLTSLLDKEMAGQVRVATIRNGCLILVTPSAALATRLKLDQTSIVRSLNAAARINISTLQVRTAPIPRLQENTRKRRAIPDAAREVLSRFKK